MNLREIDKKFGTQAKCLSYLEKMRWGKVVKCSYCLSERTHPSKSEEGRHYCYNCKRSFTVFVGTIFEDTRLDLPTWFKIITLMLNNRMGFASKQLASQIGCSLKTAWLTSMKVRCAMIDRDTKLHGVLQMDESYFSASSSKKLKKYADNAPVLSTVTQKRGRGTNKTAVVGIVETGGSVRTKIIDKLTTRNLLGMLKNYVRTDESVLVTDGFRSYAQMDEAIEHVVVKHSERKKGHVNTNTIEGYWSIIKNGIKGNYRSLSKKYLPFYLVQYEYQYNRRNRKVGLFDEFIKNALHDESVMLNYKPIKPPKIIVYGKEPRIKKVVKVIRKRGRPKKVA
jgi:transposase-like protein